MASLVLRNPANGAVVFDSNTATTHIRASFVTTAGFAGATTIPGMSAAGTPFILSAVPVDNQQVTVFPTFTFSGDTVSWTAGQKACRVIVASHS